MYIFRLKAVGKKLFFLRIFSKIQYFAGRFRSFVTRIHAQSAQKHKE